MDATGSEPGEQEGVGASPTPSRHGRVRRRKWFHRLPPLVREFAVELGLVTAVLLAVFLLLEPWDIREALYRRAAQSWNALSASLDAATRTVVAAIGRLTLSDATAVVLLLFVVLIGLLRLRWRIIHMQRLWNTACPKCGLLELRRIHRRLVGRLLGALGLPVGRYRCHGCGWEGLRIRKARIISAPLPKATADKMQ